jgi:predicted DNA-binding antitoxin AbrB/MazE fold protein
MNKGNLVVFLLFLMGGVALAAVYKWVDESGMVHYGDSPPPDSDVQSVSVPEGPTQEVVDRARQQMQEKIEQYQGLSEKITDQDHPEKSSRHSETRLVSFDNVDCFSPLSDTVQGTSSGTYTPITAISRTETQQKTLINMFKRMESSWKGKITDLTCMGTSSEPKRKMTNYEARTKVDWDTRLSRLVMETDAVGRETHAVERLFQRFQVDDVLYFSDYKQAGTISLEGNKVEVLNITENAVSFIIKRRIQTRRILRAEVRYLELSDKTLKQIELYYHNDLLTGSRTWALH